MHWAQILIRQRKNIRTRLNSKTMLKAESITTKLYVIMANKTFMVITPR